MLSRLSVRNLAVVEAAEIHFTPGLNVITGETGAGKSVLMGALRLLLGTRADRTVIRSGAEEATVAAVYELSDTTQLNALLSDSNLPLCEDGILLLRRTLRADGTGRVRINDAPATVASLRKLAPLLTDIHGPDDNLTLLDANFQLKLLESYAAAMPEKVAYTSAWQTLQTYREELLALTGDPPQRERELACLRDTLADIDAIHPTLDDGDNLTELHAQAANAEAILETGNQMLATLSEGDLSVAALLVSQHRHLRELARLLPEATTWTEEITTIQTQLQSIISAISTRLSQIDTDPDALAQLEARVGQIQRLRRRYGPSLEDVLRYREETQARLTALADAEETIYRLNLKIQQAEATLLATGNRLRQKLQQALPALSTAITAQLRDLGFLQSSFPIALEPLSEPSAHGLDRVIFRFEPNPGEDARPLAAIASSGEIARVMLAVKVILAQHDATASLVFDEIDANIGGETGRKVGEKLRNLATHTQILCITHQPQAAVYGQHHLCVRKTVTDGRTLTSITPLDATARITEIARMLGGEDFTPITREHALEMLQQASAPTTL